MFNNVPSAPLMEFPQDNYQYVNLYPQNCAYLQPYIPVITDATDAETSQLVEKLKELVVEIIPRSETATRRESARTAFPFQAAPLHIDLSQNEYNLFKQETQHISYPSHQRETQRRENNLVWICLAGLALMGISAYFSGKGEAKSEKASGERLSFNELKTSWSSNRCTYLYYNNNELVRLLDSSIAKAEAIFEKQAKERESSQTQWKLSFATGALLLSGACIGSSALIGSGLVLGSTAAVYSLYQLGYQHFSQAKQTYAKDIEENLGNLPPQIYR